MNRPAWTGASAARLAATQSRCAKVECTRAFACFADGGRDHCAQLRDIKRGNEMHFDLPLAGGSLEGGANRGRGVERFGQQIGNAPGFTLGGGQTGNEGFGCGVARQVGGPLKRAGYPDDIDRVSNALSRSFQGSRPQEHRQFLHSFSSFDLWFYTLVSTCWRWDGQPPNGLCSHAGRHSVGARAAVFPEVSPWILPTNKPAPI